MKAKLIDVDPDNCRGCRLCEMACSLKHERECSSAKSRIRVLKESDWAFDCPVFCLHCAEAPCIESCPAEALCRDDQTGAVLVNDEACTGCETCITVCPLHALVLSKEKEIILKCDLCGGDPECVKWCAFGALVLKEVDVNAPERKALMDKTAKYLSEA